MRRESRNERFDFCDSIVEVFRKRRERKEGKRKRKKRREGGRGRTSSFNYLVLETAALPRRLRRTR
jgi:hypothetical protein